MIQLVGNLYNKMCGLVVALDYEIDLATRVCGLEVWSLLIMLKYTIGALRWTINGERERERESVQVWTEV